MSSVPSALPADVATPSSPSLPTDRNQCCTGTPERPGCGRRFLLKKDPGMDGLCVLKWKYRESGQFERLADLSVSTLPLVLWSSTHKCCI